LQDDNLLIKMSHISD